LEKRGGVFDVLLGIQAPSPRIDMPQLGLAEAVKIADNWVDFLGALLARWTVSIRVAKTVVACAQARLDTFVIYADLALSTKPGSNRRRRHSAGLSVVRGSEAWLDTFVIHADLALATDKATDRGWLERAQYLV